MNGNRKLFWKEVSNAKGGKVKSCSIIKDENGKKMNKDVNGNRKLF